ncbi:hypothetical protein JOC36_001192 [Weissella uvarum]|uniref:DUF7671 family protein n=1 Tax=Weissella uvarum TaxID=1479233 RepID=UPI00195F73EA|nr:hypothetical protein [Weissella uvarum]MBM7617630.1 hypothetical protein [Weissella uvarum]MCM0595979.1 hypothetical protein [Weissella uvarum]
MTDKYPTAELIGVVVEQDNNGTYQPKNNPLSEHDFHSWRIGKHTKGRLGQPGQIFLTENNQLVVLVATRPLAFKDRHAITPMNRFLKESVHDDVLHELTNLWECIH